MTINTQFNPESDSQSPSKSSSFYAPWQAVKQVFSSLYEPLANFMFANKFYKETLFEKGSRENSFQHYQAWCNALNTSLQQIKFAIAQKSHPNQIKHSIAIMRERLFAKEQVYASPLRYWAFLFRLENEVKNFAVFQSILEEERFRFEEKLKNNPEMTEKLFYHDVMHHYIQLSGNKVSRDNLVNALNIIYRNSISPDLLESVVECLRDCPHTYDSEQVFDPYKKIDPTLNEALENIFVAVNKVFTDFYEKYQKLETSSYKIMQGILDCAQSVTTEGYNLLKNNPKKAAIAGASLLGLGWLTINGFNSREKNYSVNTAFSWAQGLAPYEFVPPILLAKATFSLGMGMSSISTLYAVGALGLLSIPATYAQAPADYQYFNPYEGSGVTKLTAAAATPTGETISVGSSGTDILVMKTNVNGTVSWANTYGGNGTETATNVFVNATTGLITLSANTNSFSANNNNDAAVLQLDPQGNPLWATVFGGAGNEQLFSMVPNLNTSGIYVGGSTTSLSGSILQTLIAAVNNNGTVGPIYVYQTGGDASTARGLYNAAKGLFVTGLFSGNVAEGTEVYWMSLNELLNPIFAAWLAFPPGATSLNSGVAAYQDPQGNYKIAINAAYLGGVGIMTVYNNGSMPSGSTPIGYIFNGPGWSQVATMVTDGLGNAYLYFTSNSTSLQNAGILTKIPASTPLYFPDWLKQFGGINSTNFYSGFLNNNIPMAVGAEENNALIVSPDLNGNIADCPEVTDRPQFAWTSFSGTATYPVSPLPLKTNMNWIPINWLPTLVIKSLNITDISKCFVSTPTSTSTTSSSTGILTSSGITSSGTSSKTSSTSDHVSTSDSSSNDKTGIIAGILSAIIGTFGIVTIIYLFLKWYRKHQKEADESTHLLDPNFQEMAMNRGYSAADEQDSAFLPSEISVSATPVSHRQVGGEKGTKYTLLTRVTKEEAQEIKENTGKQINFPANTSIVKVKLGEGAFGNTRIARDNESRDFLAVKKVKLNITSDQYLELVQKINQIPAQTRTIATVLELVLQYDPNNQVLHEALRQSELSGTPNIMPILDVVLAPGKIKTVKGDDGRSIEIQEPPKVHFYMPLSSFGDGRKFIYLLNQAKHRKLLKTDFGPIHQKLLVHVSYQLLIGIYNMHVKGMYHLDIKPANLVINYKGKVEIIDFGCTSKSKLQSLLLNKDYNGDTRYFSPERLAFLRNDPRIKLLDGASQEKVDHFDADKADAWALGVTLYELATSRYPFDPVDVERRISYWDTEYFKRKLLQLKELQNPEPDSLFAVIKGLLDPNPQTRLTIDQALLKSVFKHQASQFRSPEEQTKAFAHLQTIGYSLTQPHDDKSKYPNDNYVKVYLQLLQNGMLVAAPSDGSTQNNYNNNVTRKDTRLSLRGGAITVTLLHNRTTQNNNNNRELEETHYNNESENGDNRSNYNNQRF